MIKVSDLKKDFPIFDRVINGKRLTYLDSGKALPSSYALPDKS
jgi:selenocysteine lyase/cysteine desulfurase